MPFFTCYILYPTNYFNTLYNQNNLNCRASPKKESKSVSSSASTSFDDFQESVSDAWEIEAEDEILRISGKDSMIFKF